MAEWLFERGIGECRAVLVENDHIVEAHIERDSDGARAGAIVAGRLTRQLIAGRRGIVTLEGGEEALLEPIPKGLTEGATLFAEIVRERIPEPGRAKLAKVRVALPGAIPCAGPDLFARISATNCAVKTLTPYDSDYVEQAGWSELLEEAMSGQIAFPGGGLILSLTPAMSLFDVDGSLPPSELAVAGAKAAAHTIRRFGLGGSIGIDLPTVSNREERQAATTAFDAILPLPFERTAVNGFGFLQIVRRRSRASLPEIVQGNRIMTYALALLRRAERAPGHGARTITAHPDIIALYESRPDWLEAIARQTGTAIHLRGDGLLAISSGHVSSEIP